MNPIDDMKALIQRRSGIARGNRYGVHFTHPVTEATHNHHLAKKPYSMATDEVTMSFMLTGDYYMKKYFDVWQEMIVNSSGNHYKTMYKNDYCAQVQIDALIGDEDKTVGYSCKLMNAYPIQVSQVELGEGAEGIMEITVTWEYDNWKSDEKDVGVDGFENKNEKRAAQYKAIQEANRKVLANPKMNQTTQGSRLDQSRAAQYKAISAANRAENRKIARSRHNRGLIQ